MAAHFFEFKATRLFCPLRANSTMAFATAQQSFLPEDAAQIYADIEKLKKVDETRGWNEPHWKEASELYDCWLNNNDGVTDAGDCPPLHPLGEWLADKVDPITSSSFDVGHDISRQDWIVSETSQPQVCIDPDQWIIDVAKLLTKGWNQYERFSVDYEPENIPTVEQFSDCKVEHCVGLVIGDLADEAYRLRSDYRLIDSNVFEGKWFIFTKYWSALEQHIDPEGVLHGAFMKQVIDCKVSRLKAKGAFSEAAQWSLPLNQWVCPKECSKVEWANVIKSFDRRAKYVSLEEFLADVELAENGVVPFGDSTAIKILEAFNNDPHTKIRNLVKAGTSPENVQELINQFSTSYSGYGLAKYGEQFRESLDRQQDIADALEDLLVRGAPPKIHLADYVPADWIPMFRVLREGLKFSDEAIVMTVMAGVASMLPPKVRIRGRSMEEIPTVWVFLIGSSGTAKSVLLRSLINSPMANPISFIDGWNNRDNEQRQACKNDDGELPPTRKRNLIYTAPTTQGIRADLAEHGEDVPGLLVRDELNGWLKQMADEGGAGVGDVEFWLSSYDGAYSNDVFADAKKSREVRTGKLGVIGGIQPKVFLEQLEAGNANGFNSRPLFVHLPRERRVLVNPDDNTNKLSDVLGELYLAALQESNIAYVLSAEAEKLFINLFNHLEHLSLQAGSEEVEALWAKGPGQVLRVAAAIHFMRVATALEKHDERGFGTNKASIVSERSLELAANLVMAGKTRAVELHERASNPMLERADKLLEKALKKQGKAPGQGVALSAIRKSWSSKNRPSLSDLKQMATMLQSRGLVQLLDGGNSIRVVR